MLDNYKPFLTKEVKGRKGADYVELDMETCCDNCDGTDGEVFGEICPHRSYCEGLYAYEICAECGERVFSDTKVIGKDGEVYCKECVEE